MEYKVLLKKISRDLNIHKIFDNREWLNHQLKRGRLNTIWIEVLPMMASCLQLVYPDKWDIQISLEHNTIYKKVLISFSPIVRFPFITIKNSSKKELNIKDLFIKVKFDTRVRITGFYGVRTTVSEKELVVGYIHSHLSRSSYSKLIYHGFCTGTGQINQLEYLVNSDPKDRNVFLRLLMQLNTLANYESTEGNPYISVNEVINFCDRKLVTPDNYYLIDRELEGLKDVIINKARLKGLKLNFKKNGNRYEVVDNEVLENYCKCITDTPNSPEDYPSKNYSVCIKSENGDYHYFYQSGNRAYEMPNPNEVEPILFRGVDIPLVINQDYKIDELNYDKLYVSPQIKQYIKNYVEHKINYSLLRQSIMQRLSTSSSNTRECVPADNISM